MVCMFAYFSAYFISDHDLNQPTHAHTQRLDLRKYTGAKNRTQRTTTKSAIKSAVFQNTFMNAQNIINILSELLFVFGMDFRGILITKYWMNQTDFG